MDFLHLQEELKNCRSVCALFLLVSVRRIGWHYMKAFYNKLLLYWLLEAIEVQSNRLNSTEHLHMVVDLIYKLYKLFNFQSNV